MASNKFKTGDIVKLKSGGPKMTVCDYSIDFVINRGKVQCQWFAGNKLQEGYFEEESLEPVEDESDKTKEG